MDEDQLRELLDDVLAAGTSMSDILGLALTLVLDGSFSETEVTILRQAILSWQRLRNHSVKVLSL